MARTLGIAKFGQGQVVQLAMKNPTVRKAVDAAVRTAAIGGLSGVGNVVTGSLGWGEVRETEPSTAEQPKANSLSELQAARADELYG